jgi:hypothetical protein
MESTENTKASEAGRDDSPASNERREALKKVAIYSAYAAPVLLALSKPAKTAPVVSMTF